MLAYAFWHWRRPEIPVAQYELHQRAFQSALALHPPQGFLSASTVKGSGASWAAQGGEAYEDWYLLGGMPDLERLNEAAVTAARQASHDAVARLAAGGTAGLYGLKAGSPLPVPTVAAWFGKPVGVSYSALIEALGPLVASVDGALWMRQMVLGPTPEFCLHSSAKVELPTEYVATRHVREPIWPVQHPAA